MEIPFIKMEANGNNYLLILEESISKNININHLVSKMSNKYYGIGSDGALILSNSYRPIPYVEIYNSDGSKANFCVNGLRIVSKYLFETKFIDKNSIKIKTDANIHETIKIDNKIIVKVKSPKTYNSDVYYFNNKKYELFFLDIGNKHVYIINNGLKNINFFKNVLGRQLSQRFDSNIGLITPISSNSFSIITYERGSRLTKSCGSNICGAVALLNEKQIIDKNSDIDVDTLGGMVKCKIIDDEIEYTGTINLICKGTFYL